MADDDFTADEEIINLTELIESGANATKTGGAAAYAKAAATIQEDNFKDYLADLDMGQDDSESVDADEKLDMAGMGDIENLLDSFDIPAQPQPAPREAPAKPAAASPKKQEPEVELDSLLDDLLMPGEDAPKKETHQKAASNDPLEEIDADLNSILQEAGAVEQEASAPQAEAAEAEKLSDELDLNFDIPEMAASETEAPIPNISTDMPEDADIAADFLTESEAPVNAPGNAAAPVSAREAAESAEKNQSVAEPFLVQPVQEVAFAPETLATICTGIIKAQGAGAEETIRDFSHKLGFQAARLEDVGKRLDELSGALQESSRELQTAREKISALEKETGEKLSLKALFEEGTPLNNGFMGVITAGIARVMENAQPAPDSTMANHVQEIESQIAPFAEKFADIEAKLQALEENQGNAEKESAPASNLQVRLEEFEEKFNPVAEGLAGVAERLGNVEGQLAALAEGNNGAASEELMARLESLETQESGFLAKFASIEGRLDSLEAGISAINLKLNEVNLTDLPQNLLKIATLEKSLNARMDALEKRLDSLEPGFNGEIEKAAAHAVAKILHEEIARLAAGD